MIWIHLDTVSLFSDAKVDVVYCVVSILALGISHLAEMCEGMAEYQLLSFAAFICLSSIAAAL